MILLLGGWKLPVSSSPGGLLVSVFCILYFPFSVEHIQFTKVDIVVPYFHLKLFTFNFHANGGSR